MQSDADLKMSCAKRVDSGGEVLPGRGSSLDYLGADLGVERLAWNLGGRLAEAETESRKLDGGRGTGMRQKLQRHEPMGTW